MSFYPRCDLKAFNECAGAGGRVYILGPVPVDFRWMETANVIKKVKTGVRGLHAYELTDAGRRLS